MFSPTRCSHGVTCLSVLLISTASLTRAEDWTEFRGSAGQGDAGAVALPTSWGPSTNVVWKTKVPGSGWSSPVVVGGRIYVTSAVPIGGEDLPTADRSLRVMAVDAADGKLIWNEEVFLQKAADAPKIHKKNSHASPTIVFSEGQLIAHFGHRGSACLDAGSGSILWRNSELKYAPVHGNGGSPVIVDDLVIFNADAASDPAVIALSKKTGKLQWKFARQSGAQRKFSFSTPLLIEVDGKRQLITPGSGVVNALDPVSGVEIWRFNYDQGYSVVPRPIFTQGLVVLSTGYDSPRALAIRPDGKGDVTATHLAWEITKRAPHNPSMVAVGDLLYMVADNGVMSCVEAKSGEVVWEERACGPISASLLHAGGKIYLQDEAGLGVVVKAGRMFQIISKNDLKERSLASVSVCDQHLIIRTLEHLYRIGTP